MQKQKKVVMLDMDGVMCDFHRGVCDLVSADYKTMRYDWPLGTYKIEDALKKYDPKKFNYLTEEKLWQTIDECLVFWPLLKEFEYSRDLYAYLKAFPDDLDIVFCSTPSKNPNSLHGKMEWIYRFTKNDNFRSYIFTPRKELCADEHHILIDDSDENIRKFKEAGGKGILFPQPWNSLHDFSDSALAYTVGALSLLIR